MFSLKLVGTFHCSQFSLNNYKEKQKPAALVSAGEGTKDNKIFFFPVLRGKSDA